MTTDALIDALPDLVVLVRRDGILLGQVGGVAVADLRPTADAVGRHIKTLWPEHVTGVISQVTRRAIALRSTTDARFEDRGQSYEVRGSAQGPDRAICVIRPVLSGERRDALESTSEFPRPQLDRRGFLRRFHESMALAALCEKPIAVAIIQIDGITDIARLIDSKVSEQVVSAAILGLPPQSSGTVGGEPPWYLGQLSESLLALVLETSDRDVIETCVSQVCARLRNPISIGDAEFCLTPYAGVAILGQDAASPKALVDRARAAATEAQRTGCATVCFFTKHLKVRSLARLDSARELREAIANRDIRLHYVGRHDLATGRLVTCVGFLRWMHPVRGEVRPAEFVSMAETTGQATALSRAVLQCLREDFATLAPRSDTDVRISFGALRHHILHEEFVSDIQRFLADGAVPPERLELRIAERTFVAGNPAVFNSLVLLGVQLVVDEVARGLGSLDSLARAPIWGLQLDRAWVTELRTDEVALRVCRAGIGVATALGLIPIATGVDDRAQRDALLALGCQYGSGDLYREAAPGITQQGRAAVSG
jgi:EAL domain-containing protein (putative c-di-GMP-specific phosphodiesterase class I)/GGDEF domain-containing protein